MQGRTVTPLIVHSKVEKSQAPSPLLLCFTDSVYADTQDSREPGLSFARNTGLSPGLSIPSCSVPKVISYPTKLFQAKAGCLEGF